MPQDERLSKSLRFFPLKVGLILGTALIVMGLNVSIYRIFFGENVIRAFGPCKNPSACYPCCSIDLPLKIDINPVIQYEFFALLVA